MKYKNSVVKFGLVYEYCFKLFFAVAISYLKVMKRLAVVVDEIRIPNKTL